MVGSHSESMSDRAMLEATGRHPDEWFALLDVQQATGWKHRQIVDWIRDEAPEVADWWTQAITIRYEQARGMRQPGQRADGTFEGSISRTFEGDQQRVLDLAVAAVSAVHGEPARVTRTGAFPSARWKAESGSLELRISPEKGGKSPAVLTWAKLPDAASLDDAKVDMAALLDSIAT